MSKSRGRPRRPPRTDPAEIEQNATRWDEKVQTGLDAIFPFTPRTEPLTEEEIEALYRVPTEEQLAAAAEKARNAPPWHPTEENLNFDRTLVEHLRTAGAPLPPSWVLDEACKSWEAKFTLMLARGPDDDAQRQETVKLIMEMLGPQIRDPGGRGVKKRLELFCEIEEKLDRPGNLWARRSCRWWLDVGFAHTHGGSVGPLKGCGQSVPVRECSK